MVASALNAILIMIFISITSFRGLKEGLPQLQTIFNCFVANTIYKNMIK